MQRDDEVNAIDCGAHAESEARQLKAWRALEEQRTARLLQALSAIENLIW